MINIVKINYNVVIMKKFIKLFIILIIFWINHAFAASIDHFDITLWTQETAVNKSVDLTVEAKDKQWNTVTDYTWTILIYCDPDQDAIVPDPYTFKTSDQWKVKFENALTFKTTWKQTVYVVDEADNTWDIIWTWDINVTDTTSTWSLDISISSPEDWVTIWKNSVTVAWTTQENHQVQIKVNWSVVWTTTSDSSWSFQYDLSNLESWETKISADVLDSDNNVVWSSTEIKINIDANTPEFNSIKITPSLKVEAESVIDIEVDATKWLKEVDAIINDEITKLTETSDWVYEWKTSAPSDDWEYNVNVKLINDLWNQTTKNPATKLTVIPKTLDSWAEQVVVDIVDWTWTLDSTWSTNTETKKIYKITNLQLTKLKDRSILTWDKINEAESYNIYKQLEWNKLVLIDNVTEPRYEVPIVWDKITYDYFVVEPVVRNESWELITWELSDATQIQTWPEIIILLVFSLIIWLIVSTKFRKSKNY